MKVSLAMPKQNICMISHILIIQRCKLLAHSHSKVSPHIVSSRLMMKVNFSQALMPKVLAMVLLDEDEIDFGNVVIEHLRTSGVQQAHKEDHISFTSIKPFPGKLISGEGLYEESEIENANQKRAAIFGPEHGTLGRADIIEAAREARNLQFDILVCCAFNYDAHSSEINKLADLTILKARMNPDLHMAEELKNTGKGNLLLFGSLILNFWILKIIK